jgi:hypothetical protein
MIGFFPTPHPDELFYSLCARYHHRAGYRANRSTMRDLFGGRIIAAIDLPGSFGELIARLPPGHYYSIDQLIDQHTLLPFYTPFLSPERVTQLRYDMTEKGRGGLIHSRVGTIFTAKMRLEFLRYCPACVAEDRRQYGEAYWHRLHQTPGVIVCYHHAAWLEPSSLYVLHRGQHRRFLRAEQLVRDVPVRLLKPDEPDHQAHLWIARETKWLLNNFPGANSPKQLWGRYHGLLFDRGLASYGGVIRTRELQAEFRTFYSEQLLSEIHCRLDRPWNWLVRLMNHALWAHHPIHHLLLMRFLHCSAAEFFQLPTGPQPFGAGPWPCLNPVCEHYQEPSIEKFKVRPMKVGDQVKKAADFRCECGFTYSRPFPDATSKSDADHYEVMSCGPIWEEALRQLYHSGKYTRREMAEKLGVKPNTIMSKVGRIRRGQQIPDSRDLAKRTRALARAEARRSANELKRTRYREQWLQAIKNYPTAGRSQLGKIEQPAYSWLLEYDRQWFEANSPPSRPNPGPPAIHDWKQRDSELASAARAAAESIRQDPGRPIRVSRLAIAKKIGELSVVTKQAHRIPLTIAVLEEVSESLDEWAVRRIHWAAETFRREGLRPTSTQVLNRAVVERRAIRKKLILRTALETVMRAFGSPEMAPDKQS